VEQGIDRAVLLPRDPRTAFLFWEVREETLGRHIGRHRGPGELALRLTEEGTSHLLAEGSSVPRIGSWYFHLPRGGVRARAQVGLRDPGGGFIPLVVSNPVGLPREEPPPAGSLAGAAPSQGRSLEEIFRLSGGGHEGFVRGGASRPPQGKGP